MSKQRNVRSLLALTCAVALVFGWSQFIYQLTLLPYRVPNCFVILSESEEDGATIVNFAWRDCVWIDGKRSIATSYSLLAAQFIALGVVTVVLVRYDQPSVKITVEKATKPID